MAKNKEIRTPEEVSLYNEIKKLAKRANQRILRLERLTGETGTFATKQLYDYLDTDLIQGITPKGRIRVSKKFDIIQLEAIKRTTENFLNDKKSISKVSQVKKYTAELSKEAGKKLSYKQSNVYYKSEKSYVWIYKYIPPSEFWHDIVPTVNRENWSEEEFINKISGMIYDRALDEELKIDLINLYYYVRE